MALVLVFLLGIGNFALHKAVLESGHPMLVQLPQLMRRSGGRISLALEFAMLLGSMLMVADGAEGWAWGYGAYSLTGAFSGWLVLTGRV